MRREVRSVLPALAVVLVLLVPSLALGILSPSPAVRNPSGPTGAVLSPASASPSVPATGRASSRGPLTVAEIRQDLAGRGVSPGELHLPALFAEGDRHTAPVAPTYSTAPAPMGVADIGLRNGGGGPVGYVLTTLSAEGTVSLTDAQSAYLDGDGPDMFGLQFNSVLTNVTLFGNSSYEFWTQEFVSYTSSSGQLTFGDNLWNFSNLSGEISPNALAAHGPNGSLVAPVFYYAVGPTFTIRYPFVVNFYLNATEIGERPAVYFNYTVSNATFRASGSFDDVVFNSSLGVPAGPAPAAVFAIDGEAYDPVGLINDLELVIVGNGHGDTTTFFQIDGSLSIAYWNSTVGAFRPVPSAVNAGADAGETSDGVASYYTGTTPVAHLGPGPSFLTGLWNSSTAPGIRTVVSTVGPAPVMILANPGTSRNASAAQWVPSSPTGTTSFFIPNTGAVFLDYLLSDYTPFNDSLPPSNANGSFSVSGALARDPALGTYTPMIAWGDPELAVFATSGAGTAASPYVLYHAEPGPLLPEFAQANGFGFPVFPGLELVRTTDYVDVTPPPFLVYEPLVPCDGTGSACAGPPLPNDLQLEFWNASHVALENATITGWLPRTPAPFFPLGEVIFWNSTQDLIANNTFEDQGSAIALYGGNANVVWGNRLLNAVASLPADPSEFLGGPNNQSGIWESESGDLVYNNYFSVPSPAYAPPFDPLSCQTSCAQASALDQWNVSKESAALGQTVLGTNLSGSIIGTPYQGGNYWSNYGTPSNPYGALPYVDRPAGSIPPAPGRIALGGDSVPLVPFSLYLVAFRETGLPNGTAWSVNSSLAVLRTTATSIGLEAPNGTYPFAVSWPGSLDPPYGLEAPSAFTVSGFNVTVDLTFVPYANVSFAETGLEPESWWTLTLNGTGIAGNRTVSSPNATISFLLGPGNYSYRIASQGYGAAPASGSLRLTNGSAETVPVTFTARPVPLWLALLVPTCAEVAIDSGAPSARTCGVFRTNVTPGAAHLVEVIAPGFSPYFLNVTLFVGTPAYPINVSMTPLPRSSPAPAIGSEGGLLIALLLVLVAALAYLMFRGHRRRRRAPPPPIVPVPVPSAPTDATALAREGREEEPASDAPPPGSPAGPR